MATAKAALRCGNYCMDIRLDWGCSGLTVVNSECYRCCVASGQVLEVCARWIWSYWACKQIIAPGLCRVNNTRPCLTELVEKVDQNAFVDQHQSDIPVWCRCLWVLMGLLNIAVWVFSRYVRPNHKKMRKYIAMFLIETPSLSVIIDMVINFSLYKVHICIYGSTIVMVIMRRCRGI